MEQLMDQVNERVARSIAEHAEAEHVASETQRKESPTTRRAAATAPATIPSIKTILQTGRVKLMLLSKPPADLTRFESRSLDRFRHEQDTSPYIRTQQHKEGPTSYRYARPLLARQNCLPCHAAHLPAGPPPAPRKPPVLGVVAVEIPYQVDDNQIYLNRIFVFVAGILAGTLAVIVFYLITTRLILRPVRVLRETAEKVSKGDLNIRSDISTGDEFQKLSETFNKMLRNLQSGENQLRAINKSLDLKLGELAESNLALYESNRLKSEFLANVSHELRTPLNSILGFADLLRESCAPGDAKASRYVQNICTSGRHLLDLINDLLDLAKIEAGRMEVRSEPLSLVDLFEGLVNIIRPLAEKKTLAVEGKVDSDVPILHTDPAKLQQVLYNFLSNAIKFSPTSGRIDLHAQRANDQRVRISVKDHGPGIALEKQTIIFEKFRQIDGSATREHGGSGLGLAISKELTSLLGGDIGVESQVANGATFWVELPIRIEAGAQTLTATHPNH